MDVASRGSRTYIKVDSIEPPHDGDMDVGPEVIPLRLVPEEGGRTDLDVTVIPDDVESGSPKAGKCMDRCGCLKCVLLVASVCIGVLSVVFDWLWVNDMVHAQKALVFGPPGKGVLATLIIVASLGTITYLGENADKIKKFVTGTEWFDEESEELGSLFLEEVPEITLNMLLAMCREVPTSYFQLIKAVLAMLSSGLRILKGLCYLFGCKEDKKNKRKLRCSGWIILMIACIYTFSASICVFVFTYVPTDGTTRFHVPKAVIGKHYNTEKYFPNAGIFFWHPSFDHCDHGLRPSPHRDSMREENWLQVADIYTFLGLGMEKVEAGYAYNDSIGTFWVNSTLQQVSYNINLKTCTISKLDPKLYDLNPNNTMLIFTFIHIPKSKTLVFGDIQFNVTMKHQTSCNFLTTDDYGHLYNGDNTEGRLHYFVASTDKAFDPVVYVQDTALFFQYHAQLTNVSEAWRTGHHQCTMTGSYAPNPNQDIYRTCVYGV